jgi:hypothetical protein
VALYRTALPDRGAARGPAGQRPHRPGGPRRCGNRAHTGLWRRRSGLPGAVDGGLVATHGLPERLPVQAARLDALARLPYVTDNGCVFAETVPRDAGSRCFAQADRIAGPKVVLWGDSFAGQHIPTIEHHFRTAEESVVSVVATGCSPLPGANQYFGKGRADYRCQRMNRMIFDQLQHRRDIRGVILVGRWSNLYGLQAPGGLFDPNARFLTDAGHRRYSLANSLAVMEASLDRTITMLRARHCGGRAARTAALYRGHPALRRPRPVVWRLPDRCTIATREEDRFRAPINAVFTRLANRHPDITIFDPTPNLCTAERCSGFRNGILITQDIEHLTPKGSEIALRGLSLFQ